LIDPLQNSVVMITGGAGFLGRAITHYALQYCKPRKVVVYSRDEEKHRKMEVEFNDERLHFRNGCVSDADRLRDAMHDADIIIHAAAMKQVPACERDPSQVEKTNIMGSATVARIARQSGVERAIFISSDKAVFPLNAYGKSKSFAEHAWIRDNVHKRIYSATRWGNIEGSTGSVIKLFREMVARGAKELPITHPDMTRFLVPIDQAIATIMAALQGPPGLIVVPKSPSIRIVDLVEAMGCTYRVVGIRPGEKMHETMVMEEERARAWESDSYIAIPPDPIPDTTIDYTNGSSVFGDEIKKIGGGYSSDNNIFLTVAEIRERLAQYD
jgi:UDP-N-acetylglucosamine 4,6-dehydratase/5-epimerase